MNYSSTQLSTIGNVSKKTLRHYDKLNLLAPIINEENGYWYYDEDALNKLQLIRNLQLLGFTLKEIKNNLDNDCSLLRLNIGEKKRYLDEQMIQLEIAKRLLLKIEGKSDKDIYEAMNESFEEEHLEWYKKNLDETQFELVEKMLSHPDSMADHENMMMSLNTFKSALSKKNKKTLQSSISSLKKTFYKYDLADETIYFLIESFLKSNLEGPISQRILTVKEVVCLFEMI